MSWDKVCDDEMSVSLSFVKSGYSDPRSGDKYEDILYIEIL